MARSVRVQATVAAEEAANELSEFQYRRWFKPEMADAIPITPASKENMTKNPVAAFPIGKAIGEKCAGSLNSGPVT